MRRTKQKTRLTSPRKALIFASNALDVSAAGGSLAARDEEEDDIDDEIASAD